MCIAPSLVLSHPLPTAEDVFLVTNTFLIWNVRWEQSNRRMHNWKSLHHHQNGHLDFILRFAVKRELCVLALCSLDMSLAGFSQGWGQKWGSLPLLSLVTDDSMVRKCCWLLEGKATQPIEQQAENRSDNCILAIFIHLPDTPLWQEIQIKPQDVLRQGWTQNYIAQHAVPSW